MDSKYQELTVHVNDRFTDFLADFIGNMHEDGIEIRTGQIVISSQQPLEHLQDAVEALAGVLGEMSEISCSLVERENSDWIQIYKDSVQPIEAGKFYIHPSWNESREGMINIVVDPALAFGSGHHGTTFACLEAIGEYVTAQHSVIDVGCGSGILGLAARKMGASVSLCDTDIVSVDSAKENFALNNEEYESIWEGSVNKTDSKYDIVIANIIADVLRAISYGLQNITLDGGILILSGILDKKESIVTDAYQNLKLLERKQKDEWVTLIYKKEANGEQ